MITPSRIAVAVVALGVAAWYLHANSTAQHVAVAEAPAEPSWDDVAASAALSTVAHTAYHLGAIRQLLAGLSK